DGQTVAIVSFANYLPADLADYQRQFGIDGPSVEHVKVEGGTTDLGEGSIEANLDLDVVRGIAPRAKVRFFEAPRHSTCGAVFNAIVADGRATYRSISWAGYVIE